VNYARCGFDGDFLFQIASIMPALTLGTAMIDAEKSAPSARFWEKKTYLCTRFLQKFFNTWTA
jgi:hypothetical protein